MLDQLIIVMCLCFGRQIRYDAYEKIGNSFVTKEVCTAADLEELFKLEEEKLGFPWLKM